MNVLPEYLEGNITGSYTPEQWLDEVKDKNSDEIIQEGTPMDAEHFYFNNSVKTVALANMRSTLDYRVITEVQGNPVNVGDVVVYDKQVNGFKIAFTGSAKSVTVRCFVQGGGTV